MLNFGQIALKIVGRMYVGYKIRYFREKKMNKRRRNLIALTLSFTMFSSCMLVHAAEGTDDNVKTDYIVMVENQQVLAGLEANYESTLVSIDEMGGAEEGYTCYVAFG